jgi:hypothetical protein
MVVVVVHGDCREGVKGVWICVEEVDRSAVGVSKDTGTTR